MRDEFAWFDTRPVSSVRDFLAICDHCLAQMDPSWATGEVAASPPPAATDGAPTPDRTELAAL
ncbi:MAG: hypothetical protein H7138_19320, partial [Myxococcales bacterium]|nr:hypothetical protein [Myxococcales bacterium]